VENGFGPVATDLDSTVDAVVESIEHGPRPARRYQDRIDRTFPVRDGCDCARVVAAIEEMGRTYRSPSNP
jgi:hypothetical protein